MCSGRHRNSTLLLSWKIIYCWKLQNVPGGGGKIAQGKRFRLVIINLKVVCDIGDLWEKSFLLALLMVVYNIISPPNEAHISAARQCSFHSWWDPERGLKLSCLCRDLNPDLSQLSGSTRLSRKLNPPAETRQCVKPLGQASPLFDIWLMMKQNIIKK